MREHVRDHWGRELSDEQFAELYNRRVGSLPPDVAACLAERTVSA